MSEHEREEYIHDERNRERKKHQGIMSRGKRGDMQTSGGNEANHVPFFPSVDRVNMISAGFRVWRAGKREENQEEEVSREEKCKVRKKRGGEKRTEGREREE